MSVLDDIPYARFLGLRAEMLNGVPVVVMPFKPPLIGNPLIPALHGGATAAMMELAAIDRLAGQAPGGPIPKPINVTVAYLRVGRAQTTYAQARISRAGRRVANVLVEAWQDERDQPIAVLTAHFISQPSDGR